jgi:glycosyltransferase involved in cell wall biosynthesis
MNVSVCIATYNGEKYIFRQLSSILDQLDSADEVIIVDDCSTDNTIKTILQFADSRITVVENERNSGEVFSFGKAISLSKNDFIFLSDQDDIWMPNRVHLMQTALMKTGSQLVSTNFEWMDSNETSINVRFDGVQSSSSDKHLKNIIYIFLGKTNYFGCAMAFKRDLVRIILPIPSFVESHDLWIPLASNLIGSNYHITEKTLRKRKHLNNLTSTISTRSLYKKIGSRFIFTFSLIVLYFRYKFRD